MGMQVGSSADACGSSLAIHSYLRVRVKRLGPGLRSGLVV